jgi:hypothetical protein
MGNKMFVPSPDGRYLAGRDRGGTGVFDVATRARVGPIEQSPSNLWGFSPDGTMLIEGRDEVRVWSVADMRTPLCRAPLSLPFVGGGPVISERGRRLVFSDDNGLHDVPLAIDELSARLARAATLCLTQARRQDLLEEPADVARERAARCTTMQKAAPLPRH